MKLTTYIHPINPTCLSLGHNNLADDSVRCVGVPVLCSASQLCFGFC